MNIEEKILYCINFEYIILTLNNVGKLRHGACLHMLIHTHIIF